MIVASVEKRKNAAGCIVRLENNETLQISLDLVIKYQIRKNLDLKDDILKNLICEQRIFDVRQTALRYASYKPRTVRQVREKLKLKGFSGEESDIGIKFLYEFNLLDDVRFAKNYLNDYLKRKPAGEQKIYFELIKKGVPKDISKETVQAHFPKEDNFELAMTAAKKKLRMLTNKPLDKKKNSIVSFLARQGFGWDVIKKVTKTIFDSDDEYLS